MSARTRAIARDKRQAALQAALLTEAQERKRLADECNALRLRLAAMQETRSYALSGEALRRAKIKTEAVRIDRKPHYASPDMQGTYAPVIPEDAPNPFSNALIG